jgi:membrane protease YdiL (CAAX protease family)
MYMRKIHKGNNVTFSQGIITAAICMISTSAAVPFSDMLHGQNAETTALILRDGIVLLIGAFFYFRGSDPGDDPQWPREYGTRKWWHLQELIPLLILVFFGIKSASSIGTLIESELRVHSPFSAEILRAGTGFSGFLLAALAFVAVAPVMEEFVIRGILFRVLRTRCSFFASAALSSAAWGIWHASLSQGAAAFLIGMILALLYEIYRNLWITILIHAGNNALALYLLSYPMNTSGSHALNSGTGLLVLGCEILVAVYFYYKLIRNEPVKGRFSR